MTEPKLCRCGCGETVTINGNGGPKRVYFSKAHGKRDRAQRARRDKCQRPGCDKKKAQGQPGHEHLVRYCSHECAKEYYLERKRIGRKRIGRIPPALCACGCGRQTKMNAANNGRLKYFSERCRKTIENEKARERRALEGARSRRRKPSFMGEIFDVGPDFYRHKSPIIRALEEQSWRRQAS